MAGAPARAMDPAATLTQMATRRARLPTSPAPADWFDGANGTGSGRKSFRRADAIASADTTTAAANASTVEPSPISMSGSMSAHGGMDEAASPPPEAASPARWSDIGTEGQERKEEEERVSPDPVDQPQQDDDKQQGGGAEVVRGMGMGMSTPFVRPLARSTSFSSSQRQARQQKLGAGGGIDANDI